MKRSPTHRAPTSAHWLGWLTLSVAVIAALAVSGAWVSTSAHGSPDRAGVVVGASGSVAELVAAVGKPIPAHTYEQLSDGLNADASSRYTNVEADAYPGMWRDVAAGQYDVAITRWANEFAQLNQHRFVSFNHEPSVDSPEIGTAKEYRQAFRRFATILHDLAPKVRVVFVVTQGSLTDESNPAADPERFWPGSAAADLVSSNSFNRFGCAEKTGPWTSFGFKVRPLLDFARKHDRNVIVSEYGMDVDPRRAHWLDVATDFVLTHPRIRGLFYYNSPWNAVCEWELNTQAEYDALSRMIELTR